MVAWAKDNSMDIKGVYRMSMQRKFRWAIDTTPADWDYENTPLLVGLDKLEPVQISSCTGSNLSKKEETRVLLEEYKKVLKKYGYVLIQKRDVISVKRVEKIDLKMRLSSSYKNIYDICKKMLKYGYGYLGMLLIGEVCRDIQKYKSIKKIFVESGYVEKYKNIVLKAVKT